MKFRLFYFYMYKVYAYACSTLETDMLAFLLKKLMKADLVISI